MAYDHFGLYQRILFHLEATPRITLTALSRELVVDRHTLERALHVHAGGSFKEVQSSVLFQKAQKLLITKPNWSIKEVAFHLGYGSRRSFERLIRSRCDLSPAEFRKRVSQ